MVVLSKRFCIFFIHIVLGAKMYSKIPTYSFQALDGLLVSGPQIEHSTALLCKNNILMLLTDLETILLDRYRGGNHNKLLE